MTNSAQHMAAGKVAVMNLLSDDEAAKVSTPEGGMKLVAGDHFLDLDYLDQGVQKADSLSRGAIPHVIPQSAVSAQTWTKIVAHL